LRLTIAHENAALQKRSLEITERLFKHGNDSELDVQQAKSQYLSTLASIPQTRGQPAPDAERALRAARPPAGTAAGNGGRPGTHSADRTRSRRRHAGRDAAPPP
jgi:multidrug efflux system outer membrane protein